MESPDDSCPHNLRCALLLSPLARTCRYTHSQDTT